MTSLILDKYKDKFGQVILNDEGLFELIYGGHALDHVKAEKTQSNVKKTYKKTTKRTGIDEPGIVDRRTIEKSDGTMVEEIEFSDGSIKEEEV